jgi:CRP/FNR family transcriptional regulator, anaerobic regulatory protein
MKTSAEFRQFVMGNYGELLASLITLVEEVAFTSLDQRLARRLLAETDDEGIVSTTHQQLASDLGSVREVISRYLDEWERIGWVHASRGSIKVLDRSALSNYSDGREEYPSRPHRHHAG